MSDNTDTPGRCSVSLDRQDFRLRATFSLPARGITGLFGPSGSGKTTVLRCLAGLERAARGEVTIAGETWQATDRGVFLAAHRRQVGYVFQEARLFHHLDVAGNIDFALSRARGATALSRARVCELLGIGGLLTRRTSGLSGGERRRVAIARALLRAPRLLLMDEPLTGLDQAARRQILPFLHRLHAELTLPILYVSHRVDEVVDLCDHLIVMRAGAVHRAGPVRELLADTTVFGEAESGVLLEASVESYDAALQVSRLRFDGGVLSVAGDVRAGGAPVRLRVLARDVSLSIERPARSSIINVIATTIASIDDTGGPHVHVVLATGGAELVARISRLSLVEMQLQPGQRVMAQIKGVAVKPSAT